MNPKISLIVPCYNVEKYLPNCFACIERQTFRDFEVIFINDASTDETKELLQEYIKDRKYAKYCEHDVNKGVGETRNVGLKMAIGEFITFYDPDDVLHPNFLDVLYNTIVRHDAGMCVCKFKSVKNNEVVKFNGSCITTVDEVIEGFENVVDALFRIDNYLGWASWNKIYKSEIIKKYQINFGDIRWSEDSFFNASYIVHCKKVVLNHSVLYKYVQHSESLLHIRFSKSHFTVYKPMLHLLSNNYSECLEKNIRIYFVRITHDSLYRALCTLNSGYNNKKDLVKLTKMLSCDLKFLKKYNVPKYISLWINICLLYYKVRLFFMRDNGRELSSELDFDYPMNV